MAKPWSKLLGVTLYPGDRICGHHLPNKWQKKIETLEISDDEREGKGGEVEKRRSREREVGGGSEGMGGGVMGGMGAGMGWGMGGFPGVFGLQSLFTPPQGFFFLLLLLFFLFIFLFPSHHFPISHLLFSITQEVDSESTPTKKAPPKNLLFLSTP